MECQGYPLQLGSDVLFLSKHSQVAGGDFVAQRYIITDYVSCLGLAGQLLPVHPLDCSRSASALRLSQRPGPRPETNLKALVLTASFKFSGPKSFRVGSTVPA